MMFIKSDSLPPEAKVEISYEGMVVTTLNKTVVEAINEFRKMSDEKRRHIYESILQAIDGSKNNIKNLSPQSRKNLCDDIVLVCAADFVINGNPIPMIDDQTASRLKEESKMKDGLI